MKNMETLLNIIQECLSQVDKDLKEYKSIKDGKDLIEEKLSTKEYSSSETELEELSKILPEDFKPKLKNLFFYIGISKSTPNFAKKFDKYNQLMEDILREINDYLTNRLQELINNNPKILSLEEVKVRINNIKNKIESNQFDFTDEEIDTIYKILDSLNNRNQAIDLAINISEEIIKSHSISNEKPEENAKGDENLPEVIYEEHANQVESERKIAELFIKYNLNYQQFIENMLNQQIKENKINIFKKYFNLEIIEDILETLKNMDLLNQELFDENPNQMRMLLLYSSGANIRKVMEELESKANNTHSEKVKFNKIIKIPAIFIERKKRYKRKNGNFKEPIENKDPKFGRLEDFLKNMELFCTTYGMTPADFCQYAKYSILPNQQIKDVIEVFKFYDMDEEKYTRILAGFDSIHQADALDQFIELGMFSYPKSRVSRCQLFYDNIIFYRWIYAIKYKGISRKELLKEDARGPMLVESIVSQKMNGANTPFDMTNTNKDKFIGKTARFYCEENIAKTCEKIIDHLSVDVSLSKESEIIRLLDDNFLIPDLDGQKVYYFGNVNVTTDNSVVEWPLYISRNKVLRIYNILIKNNDKLQENNINLYDLETVMYVLTRNSLITKEEYDMIKEKVNRILKPAYTKKKDNSKGA